MKKVFLAFLTLSLHLPLQNSEATSRKSSCANQAAELGGEKVTKENALPGAVVVVGKVGPKSYVRIPTEFDGKLPIYEQNEILKVAVNASANDELEVLEPVRKIQNVTSILVKHRPTEKVGRIFWSEFKFSTHLISAGKAPAPIKQKKISSLLKFPLRQDSTAYERGLTMYGRPFAKQGDLVWAGNMARSMSPKYLGRIPPDAMMPKDLVSQYVKIELITGGETWLQPIWVIPLLPEEIQQAREAYADQIKVDWFKLPN